MASGTVKWFNSRKGYGFIQIDEEGSDIFVHANEIEGADYHKNLYENQRVEFEIANGPKGQFAKGVRVVE